MHLQGTKIFVYIAFVFIYLAFVHSLSLWILFDLFPSSASVRLTVDQSILMLLLFSSRCASLTSTHRSCTEHKKINKRGRKSLQNSPWEMPRISFTSQGWETDIYCTGALPWVKKQKKKNIKNVKWKREMNNTNEPTIKILPPRSFLRASFVVPWLPVDQRLRSVLNLIIEKIIHMRLIIIS